MLTDVPRTFQSTCVIETGLLDFHLMTLTIMRKTFKKQRPRIINYRSFKHFSNEEFRKSLIDNLSNQIYVNNDGRFNRFYKISIDTLNSFAPIKSEFVRANQMLFITKGPSREIMKRSRQKNNFLRKKTKETGKLYVKQRNKCVSLFKKS